MVKFESNKIVIEIESDNPFIEHVHIFQSLIGALGILSEHSTECISGDNIDKVHNLSRVLNSMILDSSQIDFLDNAIRLSKSTQLT